MNALPQEPTAEQQPDGLLKRLCEAYQTLVKVKLKFAAADLDLDLDQLKNETAKALDRLDGYEELSSELLSAFFPGQFLNTLDNILSEHIEPTLIEAAPNKSGASDDEHIRVWRMNLV